MSKNISLEIEFASVESQIFYPNLRLVIVALLVIYSYYIFFYRRSFRHFPNCSCELFFIIVWITRRYIKEIPATSALLTFAISISKHFEKEGLCIIWGIWPWLFIYGEDYIKTFANEPSAVDKPFTYDIFSDFTGTSILTQRNGLIWKKQRKLFDPAFRFNVLRNTITALNQGAEDIVKDLYKVINKPTDNVLIILKIGILKTFCESIFGVDLNDQSHEKKLEEYVHMISSAADYTINRTVRPWKWWKYSLLLFKDGRKHLRIYKKIQDFTKEIVTEMLKANSSTNCNGNANTTCQGTKPLTKLTSILVENYLKDPSFGRKELEDAVSSFLFAGHDTTSYTMLWSLFMLAVHPEVQEKVYEEVESVTRDSDGYISYNDLNKLKYMEAVLKETMRLYPVAPIFIRETRKEIQLGKYTIPKDTGVFVVTYLMQRNSKVYPDPNKFDPDRFYGKTSSHPWTYIPFSEGVRSCIGKNFAMMEMKIILGYILRHFKISSLDRREDILLDWKLILAPMTPIRFRFTSRRSNSLSLE